MALEESIDGLVELNHNGIKAFIDQKLRDMLESVGTITIDYMNQGMGGGYLLTVGDKKDCSGGCDGC